MHFANISILAYAPIRKHSHRVPAFKDCNVLRQGDGIIFLLPKDGIGAPRGKKFLSVKVRSPSETFLVFEMFQRGHGEEHRENARKWTCTYQYQDWIEFAHM